MTKSNNKDLAVVNNKTALAKEEEVPEFLRSQLGNKAGMESVEQTDILIPRLGVCQSLSPQRRKSDSAYIEGLEEGQLFNTVTQEIYGESVEVILLFFYKNRIKFFPIKEGGGIDCQSANGIDGGRICPDGCAGCDFSKWGNGETEGDKVNDTPLCTLYHNYMAFLPTERSPIAISYKSTGTKISKQLLAKIRLSNLPMYAKKYEVNVVEMKAGENVWYEKVLKSTGFVDSALFAEMEKNFNQLQEMNIRVDTTGENAEVGNTDFDIEGKVGSTEL